MNYKNLLVLHSLQESIDSMEPLVCMARQFDAHLEVLVLSLASPVPTMTFVQDPYHDWSKSFGDDLQKNNQRVEEVSAWLGDKGVSHEVNTVCQQLGLVDDDITGPALYAGLVMLSRGAESLVSGMMAKALKGAVFDAAKPVLVLAGAPSVSEIPFNHITIAWDSSPGVMRAIAASLPFLKQAEKIELAIVTNDKDPLIHEAGTRKIMQWLQRFDLSVELKLVPQDSRHVSEIFLEYVNSPHHELIVMGAYGHTRFAEKLFSGVTHQALGKAKTSLLMSH